MRQALTLTLLVATVLLGYKLATALQMQADRDAKTTRAITAQTGISWEVQ